MDVFYARTAVSPQIITHTTPPFLLDEGDEVTRSFASHFVIARGTMLELACLQRDSLTIRTVARQSAFGNTKDIKMVKIRTMTDHIVPVFVAMSDSGHLSFLGLQNYGNNLSGSSAWHFVNIGNISLSTYSYDYLELGRLVVVDPLSRAVAVAAFQFRFQIFLLAQSVIMENGQYEPVFDSCLFEEPFLQNAIIWQMCFLHPSQLQTKKLQLVICYKSSSSENFQLVLLEALPDSRRSGSPTPGLPQVSLENVVIHGPASLPKYFGFPLHLYSISESPEFFLLITEYKSLVIRASDLISGPVHWKTFDPPSSLDTRYANTESIRPSPPLTTISVLSPSVPDFVQTSTLLPIRHSKDEYVYVINSEGNVYLLDATIEPRVDFSFVGKVARDCSGIVMFDSVEDARYLFTWREAGNGSVVKVDEAATRIVAHEYYPNFAPVIDFKMVDLHQTGSHDLLLCCAGVGGNGGSIREVRNGIGVRVLSATEADFQGAVSLFHLESTSPLLVVSTEFGSHVLRYSSSNSLESMAAFGQDSDNMMSEGIVLSCGWIRNVAPHVIVCVTQVNVKAVSLDQVDADQNLMEWKWKSSGFISVASIVDQYICVAESHEGYRLVILETRFNQKNGGDVTFSPLASKTLASEATALNCRFIEAGNQKFFILVYGLYDGSLRILSFSLTTGQFIDSKAVETKFSEQDQSIPHSIQIVPNECDFAMIVGFRDGHVECWNFTCNDQGKVELQSSHFRRRIGVYISSYFVLCSFARMPVRLVPFTGQMSSRYLLALTDRAWKVVSSQYGMRLTPVSHERITSAVYYPMAKHKDAFAIISKESLKLVILEENESDIHTIARIESPRRVHFDVQSGFVLVSTTSKEEGRFPYSKLLAIDRISGKVVHKEKMLPDETIFSIREWSRDQERLVCVGTQTAHEQPKGRIVLYKMSFEESAKMQTFISHDLPSPVYAIHQFSPTSILVGAGSTVYLFEMEETRLIEVTTFSIRWDVTCLASWGNKIIIGSQKEGLTLLAFQPEVRKFEFIKSDRYVCPIMDCIFLSETTAASVDRYGNIRGVVLSGDSLDYCLADAFCFYLGDIPSRIMTGNFFLTEDEGGVPSSTSKNLVVVTATGSILTFLKMTKEDYQILRQLQLMMAAEQTCKPLLANDHERFRSLVFPSKNVIDGDFIMQYLYLKHDRQNDIATNVARSLDPVIEVSVSRLCSMIHRYSSE